MSRDDARREERPIENGITQTFTTFGASSEINNNHNIIIHNNNTPYYTIVNIIMIIQYHTLTFTCVCVFFVYQLIIATQSIANLICSRQQKFFQRTSHSDFRWEFFLIRIRIITIIIKHTIYFMVIGRSRHRNVN